MNDNEKTKAQLIEEIADLRQQCADLDKSAHESTLEEAKSSEVISQQQVILDNLPDNVWLKDSDGLYVSVNEPFCNEVGVASEEIVGKSDYDIFPPELAAKYEVDLRVVIESGDRTYTEESVVGPDGNTQHLERVETPIFDENGDVSGIIGIGHDITIHKELEITLRHDSTHDKLTGLYNRAFFDTELERLSRSRLFPLSIVIADVNNLKTVNDTLGHEAGDDLIKLAAGIILEEFRSEDIVARIGGDEFAVLLPLTDEKTAEQAVERLKSALEISTDQVSIAFGVAAAENMEQLHRAFNLADERMYQDKSEQKQEQEALP